MKITIHRGIAQIGGCITEIATDRSKIFIDLGHNLTKPNEDAEDEYANNEAITKLCEGCNAIFYTHYHDDHVELFRYVPTDIPQYIGGVAKQVMIAKNRHLSFAPGMKQNLGNDITKLELFKCYEANRPITIGDIKVTPYFVSHSAADAYMFLIEAEGKRILHTGDFREHSYLGKGLEKTIKAYIRGIDVLVTEGTMLGRSCEMVMHENDIQIKIKEYEKQFKNIFVLCSSTDIDRLASVYNGHKSVYGRPFICDNYQKEILQIFSDNQGTKSVLYKFDVEHIYNYKSDNQKLREWMQRSGFTMLVRSSDKYEKWCSELIAELNPNETLLIYSMFKGYIEPNHEAYNESLHNFVKIFPRFEYCHTTGHATVESLARMCNLTSPRIAIIPIHRVSGSDYASITIPTELKERIVTQSIKTDNLEIAIL